MRTSQRDRSHPGGTHLVTEARRSLSDDIAYRQRRYLIMMGVRAACFLIALVLYVNHAGWLTAIPAAGAILIPYFAVVFANGGREPDASRGFREYQPSLPVRAAHPDSATHLDGAVHPDGAAAAPSQPPGPPPSQPLSASLLPEPPRIPAADPSTKPGAAD